MRSGWRNWASSDWRRQLCRNLAAAFNTYQEVIREMEPGSLQCCMVGGWETISWNERFRMGVRKSFFILRTVKQWERLPREVVQPLSFEFFKTELDKALRNLVWPHSWPWFEQEVGLETFGGLFQPELSLDYYAIFCLMCCKSVLILNFQKPTYAMERKLNGRNMTARMVE